MANRTRKYDWDRIRELHAQGWTIEDVACIVGCNPTTVRHVLYPAERARARAYSVAWQRQGTCPRCGGQKTRTLNARGVAHCRACSYQVQREQTVKDDALWCSTCREFHPDDAFTRSSLPGYAHRRGRRFVCRAYETRKRRERRAAGRP